MIGVMKQLIFSLVFFLFAINGFAQYNEDTVGKQDSGIVYKEVSKKLNIRDKIIVQNKSPYLIMQVMVALPKEGGGFEPIGTSTYITPNETRAIASYDNNELKLLKGKILAIKVKAAKVILPENNTSVITPYGAVGVQHREIDPNIINNIKDKDVTYDFDVKLLEANHDLYIEVYYKGENDKSNVMDF